MKEDKDVLFQRCILSGNWGEEEAGALLHHIVDHWVVITDFLSQLPSLRSTSKRAKKSSKI